MSDPSPANRVTLTVDMNNPSDLKTMIARLSNRRRVVLSQLGYNGIDFNGSKANADSVLPLLEEMWITDVSPVYRESSQEQQSFYVYVHCDPSKPLSVARSIKHLFLARTFPALRYEPFYVGKGQGNRWLELKRNDSHRKVRSKLLQQGSDVVPVKIVSGLSETAALGCESKLIDILGIRSYSAHGLLVNLDEGEAALVRRKLYSKEAFAVLRRNGFETKVEEITR